MRLSVLFVLMAGVTPFVAAEFEVLSHICKFGIHTNGER